MKQGVLDEDSGKIWRRTTASKVARAPHAPATRLRVGFTRRIKLARGGAWGRGGVVLVPSDSDLFSGSDGMGGET
jgi:hypothetical protein